LRLACHSGSRELVASLVNKYKLPLDNIGTAGRDPQQLTINALYYACSSGSIELVDYLIKDRNVNKECVAWHGNTTMSALNVVVDRGSKINFKLVRYLLNLGMDINHQCRVGGPTPLYNLIRELDFINAPSSDRQVELRNLLYSVLAEHRSIDHEVIIDIRNRAHYSDTSLGALLFRYFPHPPGAEISKQLLHYFCSGVTIDGIRATVNARLTRYVSDIAEYNSAPAAERMFIRDIATLLQFAPYVIEDVKEIITQHKPILLEPLEILLANQDEHGNQPPTKTRHYKGNMGGLLFSREFGGASGYASRSRFIDAIDPQIEPEPEEPEELEELEEQHNIGH